VTTESDEGTGGRAAGSGAISAGCLWLQSQDPRSSLASRPGAQGRPRPEHRKRRGSSAVPAPGSRYGELRSWCSYIRSAVSVGRSRSDMSTPQKRPSTRRYLLTTSDNRRSARLGDGIRADRWPCRFGRSARSTSLIHARLCGPGAGRRIDPGGCRLVGWGCGRVGEVCRPGA